MARATIADIADLAGVSTATVDRVLNGRAGVSASNRQRVMRAARDLGYLPVEGSLPLPSRPAHLAFLIPFGGSAFMKDVADSVVDFAATHPLVGRCDIVPLTGIGPDALNDAIDSLSSEIEGVGLITTDHPKSREAIRRLCEAGIQVVTLASDVLATPRASYVGIDNRIAGRIAGQLLGMLIGNQTGQIAIFFGSPAFLGHQEREAGFLNYMAEHHAQLQVLPTIETGEDSQRIRTEMAALRRQNPDLVAVYCVGAGRKGIVEALENAAQRPFVVMHDLTDNSQSWLAENLIDAVIDQNGKQVGERAVLDLLGAIAAPSTPLPQRNIEPRIILRENIPAQRLT